MDEAGSAVPAELRRIVDRLTAIRSELRQIVETLRGAPEEDAAGSDEETADATTQMRSILECVLTDSLQPAIRDLRVAAAYREQGGREGER